MGPKSNGWCYKIDRPGMKARGLKRQRLESSSCKPRNAKDFQQTPELREEAREDSSLEPSEGVSPY